MLTGRVSSVHNDEAVRQRRATARPAMATAAPNRPRSTHTPATHQRGCRDGWGAGTTTRLVSGWAGTRTIDGSGCVASVVGGESSVMDGKGGSTTSCPPESDTQPPIRTGTVV